jgi:hypothetical protein
MQLTDQTVKPNSHVAETRLHPGVQMIFLFLGIGEFEVTFRNSFSSRAGAALPDAIHVGRRSAE